MRQSAKGVDFCRCPRIEESYGAFICLHISPTPKAASVRPSCFFQQSFVTPNVLYSPNMSEVRCSDSIWRSPPLMADLLQKGEYVPVADQSHALEYLLYLEERQDYIEKRSHNKFVLRHKTKFLLAAINLLFLALLAFRRSDNAEYYLAREHLGVLASPLSHLGSSRIGDEVAFVVGEHNPVRGAFPADYQWVDPYLRKPFLEVMTKNSLCNSAIGRLPVGSPYDALIIARGANDRYQDPREGVPMINLTVVGYVLVGRPGV